MSKEFKPTSGFESNLLMDPATFSDSKPVNNKIQETSTNIDIILMSFTMTEEYIKEFYRLLGINSSFSVLPFDSTNTQPIKLTFIKRHDINNYVELLGSDERSYIFLESSLKADSTIVLLDKETKKPKRFIYTTKKN